MCYKGVILLFFDSDICVESTFIYESTLFRVKKSEIYSEERYNEEVERINYS